MYGLGYIFAGFALYVKRVNRAVTVFQTLIFFISGMLYPPEAIPEILGWISRSLPITQGMHIARLSMVGLSVPSELWFMLAFTSLVYLTAGLLVFSYFARLVRKNGLLGSH
ncbi:ABC transporter permease [Thermosediminibacter litoriperuensis]|uniref:ABC-2 family transporter n=1 Tax=Thermosediminibacter litoriperuensis TaxID=291989 RepID=A0A5S5AMR1_9FIRM|nr:ABC transporter permease [Thermosediminibacter litoriperuensis]TYP52462.1 ABC-2 family transporter [Thermosediminibacter litoriperuensis]